MDFVLTQELVDGLGLLLYYLLADVGFMLDSSLFSVRLHGCLATLGLPVFNIGVDQLCFPQHFIGSGVIVMRILKFFLAYVWIFARTSRTSLHQLLLLFAARPVVQTLAPSSVICISILFCVFAEIVHKPVPELM